MYTKVVCFVSDKTKGKKGHRKKQQTQKGCADAFKSFAVGKSYLRREGKKY